MLLGGDSREETSTVLVWSPQQQGSREAAWQKTGKVCECVLGGCQWSCPAHCLLPSATGPDLISPPHPYNTPQKGETQFRTDPSYHFPFQEHPPYGHILLLATIYTQIASATCYTFYTSSWADYTMNARKYCNHKPDRPSYPTHVNFPCKNASHLEDTFFGYWVSN